MTLPSVDGLTEKQLTYAREVAHGVPPAAAAAKAGYADPARSAWILTRHPAVQSAIYEAVRARLAAEIGPYSIQLMYDLARADPKGPFKGAGSRLRLEAAKALADRAGFIAPRGRESGQPLGEKRLDELSSDELREAIGRLEQELGNRAKTITLAPNTPGDDTKVIDLLDT
ncbi:hypothetical protein [Rhodoligotrophos defluvii]|uniref:hypothetical protein n=1 Tax=Rhodoligotrophos defluvii TaxID=2561934 RepID=UPI0010C9EA48|nr:hypothetical protein [Rhodoligotrophos defluvii]